MSFGFSLTDFKEAIVLCKRLHDGIKDAPDEIKGIAKDVATLHGVLAQIQDDITSDESTLKAHGEARVKLLQSMGTNVKATLEEIQSFVERFLTAAEPRQILRRVQWMGSQRKMKKLQQDLLFHVSSFHLLMTTMGNSSLMRIETGLAAMRVDSGGDGTADECENPPLLPAAQSESQVTETVDVPAASTTENGRAILTPTTRATTIPYSPAWHDTPNPLVHLPWLSKTPLKMPLPSPECLAVLKFFSEAKRKELVEVVSSNFREARFDFYSKAALWRVTHEGPHGDKLFVLAGGLYPEGPEDLSLREWATKMHTACHARCDEVGGVQASRFYDVGEFPTGARQTVLPHIPIIGSMVSLWGSVNVDVFEEALLCAVRTCYHFHSWDSVERLKKLWAMLHGELAVGEIMSFDLSILKAPLKRRTSEEVVESRVRAGGEDTSAPRKRLRR
ncbi:hypothetical protein QBC34DRAFT_413345 [Podospora aff. communis PSN243]|uniref:F-box domain-containing protein n=1 Tax=Podospora aff. communis PSN243 TaxID=3040156 RepID=A0AAV9GBS5_9PEZI|nr:hypothetical protein QBC34DRAFT_413345 [Podospora aff. communis PSN243]